MLFNSMGVISALFGTPAGSRPWALLHDPAFPFPLHFTHAAQTRH